MVKMAGKARYVWKRLEISEHGLNGMACYSFWNLGSMGYDNLGIGGFLIGSHTTWSPGLASRAIGSKNVTL